MLCLLTGFSHVLYDLLSEFLLTDFLHVVPKFGGWQKGIRATLALPVSAQHALAFEMIWAAENFKLNFNLLKILNLI